MLGVYNAYIVQEQAEAQGTRIVCAKLREWKVGVDYVCEEW